MFDGEIICPDCNGYGSLVLGRGGFKRWERGRQLIAKQHILRECKRCHGHGVITEDELDGPDPDAARDLMIERGEI